MLYRENRLAKKKEFEEVLENGISFKIKGLKLKFIKKPKKEIKIGILISAKDFKKSTQRNKIKRRLREILRREFIDKDKIKPGHNLIFFIQKEAENKSFSKLKKIVEELLKKSNLLNKN